MQKLSLAFLCLALTACGAKQLGSVAKPEVPTPKDTPLKPPGSCPAIPPEGVHTVTIAFPRNLPTSGLGVKFPAEAGLRWNQCNPQPQQTGVIVSAQVTASNTLVVTIRHNKQFTNAQNETRLPTSQAIEVVQANCDGSNATILYQSPANAPPALTWTQSHPNGPNCAEASLGSAVVTAPDVEVSE